MGKGILYNYHYKLSLIFVVIHYHYRVDYHVDFPVDLRVYMNDSSTRTYLVALHFHGVQVSSGALVQGRSPWQIRKGLGVWNNTVWISRSYEFQAISMIFFINFPCFVVVVLFLDLLWYPSLQLFQLFVRIRLSTAEDVAVGKFPWSI